MNKPENQEAVERPIEPLIQSLEQWQAELDPVQRARLTAARRRALSARTDGARPLVWLGPALAAGVLLALGISFLPQATVPLPVLPTPGELAAGDAGNGDEALMDEDAEYLLWLASDDAA